jgi:ATP-dependent DNA ligase
VARRGFRELEAAGIEGVVAKRAEAPYAAGQRAMIKVKHARTADCVVGGYRPYSGGEGVGSLLLGAWDAHRELAYLGHTSGLSAALRREALRRSSRSSLGAARSGPTAAPAARAAGRAGRELAWVAVQPELVCEVGYDTLMDGQFRHAARFVRWRDDKAPQECLERDLEPAARPASP